MPIDKIKPLDFYSLRPSADAKQFDFKTTDDLPDANEFIGQNRALEALKFGIAIDCRGFNIYALGPSGLGKRSMIRDLLEKEAKKRPPPNDICYIHNFKTPREPLAILLPSGRGRRLAEDMNQLVELLKIAIPAIFESKPYISRIKEIQEETRKKQEDAILALEQESERQNITIIRTPEGFMLAAVKNGEIMTEQEFKGLPKAEREEKELIMKKIHEELGSYLEQIPNWNKEQREKAKEALKYFTMLQVGSLISDVKKKHEDLPVIVAYLHEVQKAILDNPSEFRKKPEGMSPALGMDATGDSSLHRYNVNVLVDNGELKGAPIIYEDNPTLTNLLGRIDHMSQFGALVTDFTLIRAGALHKANGGFLVLDAHKLLTHPFAWDALKRTLRAHEIRVENIYQMLGYAGTISIEPNPVPLDLKVVILGDRYIYYLLCTMDNDFLELFKVAADFDENLKKSPKNNLLFAQMLKNIIKKHELLPLTRTAVAEIIDHASRNIGDGQKISTHVETLSDLLREAHHYASIEHQDAIDVPHVERAIEQQVFRASRLREQFYESIQRGALLIETEGNKIGQINGLSYVLLGGFAFGHPTRITARASVGKGDLIDIEREVKLGGPIHSKGVLILTGYLNGQFAKEVPLSLSLSLVFEQSYGGVEGDSASAAEACVLLSAIAEIPLKQSFAMTGSMNQFGQIQAVGGINEKIEGFFDICKMGELTGEQGVIIPKSNVERLMLRKDVALAAKEKLFHIFPVENIDQAMELMTGLKAGAKDKDGNFPKDTINYKINMALRRYAKIKDSAEQTSEESPSKPSDKETKNSEKRPKKP